MLFTDSRKRLAIAARQRGAGFRNSTSQVENANNTQTSSGLFAYFSGNEKARKRRSGGVFGSLRPNTRVHAAVAALKIVGAFLLVVIISSVGYMTITVLSPEFGLPDTNIEYEDSDLYPQSVVYFPQKYEQNAYLWEAVKEIEDSAPEDVEEEPEEVVILPLGAGNTDNVLVQEGMRYYNAEELERGLLRGLIELAPAFVAAQEEYGIDAVFLAAVAALESGWGAFPIRETNLFGFGNMSFETKEAGVDHVASFLKRAYLTEGGQYYKGVSVTNVAHYYCPVNPSWPGMVGQLMKEIVRRIED